MLAVRKTGKSRITRRAGVNYTSAQKQKLGVLAASLLQLAKQAGAKRHAVKAGNVSFRIQGQGDKEILSIEKLVAA